MVDSCGSQLLTVINRLVRDRDAQDDILAVVWMKAYQALPNFSGESKLTTWLFRIAYNEAINHLRKVGARPEWSPQTDAQIAAIENVPSPHPTPDQDAERSAIYDAIYAASEQLPPNWKAALQLVYWDDVGYAEAARVLEVPEGTVKTWVFRAKNAIKEALEAKGWSA